MFKQAFEVPVVLFGAMIVLAQTPQITMAQTPAQVNAKQITVRIDGTKTGTGVIIKRQGNTYIVLTNWHVVNTTGKYTIQTPDGQRYQVDYKLVRRIEGADLAELQFTSNQNYQIAEYATNQVTEGTPVYVAGWADPDAVSVERSYIFVGGNISRLVSKPKDGYALVLTNITKPGMSGGPILDEKGRLVGINGQARFDPRIGATDYLGIAINTYKTVASAASVNPQQPKSQLPNQPSQPSITVTNPPRSASRSQINCDFNKQDYQRIQQIQHEKSRQTILSIREIFFYINGKFAYEEGNNELAIKCWQNTIAINNKNADALLALAVALYTKGNRQQGRDLAKQAFQIDARYSDINFFKQKGWRKRLLADTANFIIYYNAK